ncbi:hypothetical protein HanXRQr2_Chr07g0284811 [Helianthus annuus]|uniref:Uncharacterized protein n=1 Tax=Helianthus annuus TaxID=4232 RepID=A0A9K3IIU8_HELAN|nr:hypothetical protein HanXRQr2_Chr07g0284811 [Helianthus annuus]KAJ0903925.1 hypothetical protein HanPSC8_Chr07g0275721 [Helianthus annuus]
MIVMVTNLQPFYKPFKHCFQNRLSSVPSKVQRKPLFAEAFGRAAPPPCCCFRTPPQTSHHSHSWLLVTVRSGFGTGNAS